MADIMRYTKMVNDAFIEKNGNLKVNVNSPIGKRKLNERTMSFLAKYLRFVKESGLLSEPSKIWIESIESNPMDAIRTYNATSGKYKQITPKQASNHIYYDTKKLLEFFPDDMLRNVIFKKCDIAFYESALENAISKKTKKTFLGKMTILKLPSVISQEQPTSEEIDDFFTLFEPYTKESIKQVEKMIPKNVIGYINYIAVKKERSENEQALINKLTLLEKGISIE